MRVPLSLLLLLPLAACNDPGLRAAPGVIAVTAPEVAACPFVTNIAVEPPLYGPFSGTGARYARNQILNEARASGANRVVFDQVDPGVALVQLRARAYRC